VNMARRKAELSDEEVIQKIAILQRDPKRWEEYFASRIDRVLDNWPGRSTGKPKSSAKSSGMQRRQSSAEQYWHGREVRKPSGKN